MAGDARKRNHGCFTVMALRMLIVIGAAALYLRRLMSPTHPDAA
ncbi:MAG: hypothetical protein ACR652_05460 [Methylocystis sp.]